MLLWITWIEWVYLIYMFFILKTRVYIGPSLLERYLYQYPFFIHHTGRYESKICELGRVMVLVAILLSLVRLRVGLHRYRSFHIGFVVSCMVLALLLNLNAFVYLIPILILEIVLIKM